MRPFQRKPDAIKNRVLNLVAADRVFYNGIILHELLVGAKSQKQYERVLNRFNGLHSLEMDTDFFIQTAEIAKKLKLLGFTLPVNDSMIMCHAKLNKLTVLSLNRHFELTGREIGFQYEILKNF